MDQPPVRKPTAQDGGSVWALIGRDDAPDFPARWLSAYDPPNAGRAVAFGGDSTSDVLVARAGARIAVVRPAVTHAPWP
ncbi:MAG: hypothetical protein M3545_13790, partial [Acidobacteriota bacterium]|nr:hypothetical protein [Acidobacteriota bacterium]